MFDALYIGATGLRGRQLEIDSIAQNVANLQSVGYRRNVVSFAEMVASSTSTDLVGALSETNAMRVMGAGALPSLTLSTGEGELRQTREALHIAVDGQGFLEVMRPDGTPAYTRAGVLTITNERMLATADGAVLSARIQVPPDVRNLRIDANGVVSAMAGEREEYIELGRIELTTFTNPGGLQAAGGGTYVATAQSGEPQVGTPGERAFGAIRQGFLEGSNVQMTDEIVSLMLAQRAFELNSKVVQAADQLLSITNGLYR